MAMVCHKKLASIISISKTISEFYHVQMQLVSEIKYLTKNLESMTWSKAADLLQSNADLDRADLDFSL